jgi:hypothetical protein
MNLLKEVTKAFLGADTNLDEWEGKVLAQAQKGTEFKEEKQKEQKEEPLKEEKPKRLDEKNKGKEARIPSVIGEPDEVVIEKTEILRAPVVEQVIKPRELIEVQPMVVREREQTEVHEVIQPLREQEVLPPVVDTKELPVIEGEFVESQEQFEREYNEVTENFKSSVQVQDIQKERIVNQPIVQEVIHKKVIEEIQPVIHKETVVPHVLRETQPIHEHIVEAPRLLQENMDEHLESHKGLDEGTVIETRTKPPIFEEVVKPREVIEVQPVITRERDVTEVHEVVQPIQAREVLPPVIEEKELPLLERETLLESTEEFQRSYEETTEAFQSSVEVENIQRERIIKQPIVQEVLHKTIVEEIQPVIHKETVVPHIVREVLPIHEKIVEAPKLFREELEEKDLGTTFIGLGTAPLSSELEPKKNL